MNNCAIVIPYFGKWPLWFDLYLYSLDKNRGLTVFFFTDNITDNLSFKPINSKFINISFKEYCKMVSEKLKIKFNPDNPYKICDLKIFLPYIHKDILAKYDFVGWGDIDVVYGNMNKFFHEKKISFYDYISVYSCILSGPFTLIRNHPSIYMHFFDMPYWEKMLEDKTIYNLDEIKLSVFLTPKLNYLRLLFEKFGGFKGKNGILITKIIEIVSKWMYPNFYFKEFYTTRPGNNYYSYEKGCIFINNKQEIPFLHYYHLKKNQNKIKTNFEDSFKKFKLFNLDNSLKCQISNEGFSIQD